MNDKLQPGRFNKREMQVTQQVFHNLSEVVELYPQYKIAQHLSAILRRKDVKGEKFHHWSNDELLKKIEQHKEELEGDELINNDDENGD